MDAGSKTLGGILPPHIIRRLVSLIAMCTPLAGCATSGHQEPVVSGKTTVQAPGSAAATQAGHRVLLHPNFERADGSWSGKIISEDATVGGKLALAAIPTETHWARRATVGGGATIEATADMVLTFRYRTSKPIAITIYIFDATQKDNLRYDIKEPIVGAWRSVAVNINRDFRRNDHSGGVCQPGDALRGVSFLSGKTGHDEFEMAVDDVQITGH